MVKLIHPLCILGQLQLLCLCLSSAISLFPSATTAVPLPIEGSTLPPLPENQSDLAVQVFNISSRTIGSASDPQSTTLYYATCLSAVDPIKKEGLEKHSTPILGWLSYDPARYLSLQAVDGAIEAPKECPSSKFAIIKFSFLRQNVKIMELKNSIWARFVNDIIRVRGMKSNRDDSNVSGTTRILQNYDVIIAADPDNQQITEAVFLTAKGLEPSVLEFVGSSTGKTAKDAWGAMIKGKSKLTDA